MRKKARRPLSLPLTPLIDVVFQLIAFFVFALSYDSYGMHPGIQPPVWAVGGGKPVNRTHLVFQLNDRGWLMIDGEFVEPHAPEFDAYLDYLLSESPESASAVVRADRRASYGSVKRVIDKLREHGRQEFDIEVRETSP